MESSGSATNKQNTAYRSKNVVFKHVLMSGSAILFTSLDKSYNVTYLYSKRFSSIPN